MTPLVRARNLSKIYRTETVETHAVRQASLDINQDDFLVLSGPSGCGKSSLLTLLGLMERPDGGTLAIAGDDTSALADADRARLRGTVVGFVFQAFQLIPHLTVRENIQLPLSFHRALSTAQQAAIAEQAARDVGIAERLNHFPDQLSGGQQQRAAIARALAGSPKLILADEPTGNLDSENGDQIIRLLQQLHERGAAICLVTHDPRYRSVGNRNIEMSDGLIVTDSRSL